MILLGKPVFTGEIQCCKYLDLDISSLKSPALVAILACVWWLLSFFLVLVLLWPTSIPEVETQCLLSAGLGKQIIWLAYVAQGTVVGGLHMYLLQDCLKSIFHVEKPKKCPCFGQEVQSTLLHAFCWRDGGRSLRTP